MDLSSLSDADFKALQAGRLDAMSDHGFGVLIQQQQAAKSRPERVAQAQQITKEANNPTDGMGPAELMVAGAQKAFSDAGSGIKQIVGLKSRDDIDQQKKLDAPLMERGWARGGNALGSMALMAPASLLPGANTVTGAAVIGGLAGAVQPVGTEDSRTQNALYGAGGGAAATLGANALSRVLSPKPPRGTNALVDDGINLTVGQRMGGGWKRLEDGLTSVPLGGDFIKSAQRRSFGDFNAAVANKALAALGNGEKLPQGMVGRDAIAYVDDTIGKQYQSALAGIKNVQGDSKFGDDIISLQTMVHNSTMPKEVQDQFDKVIRNQISGKFQGQNSMSSQTFKDVESELGRLAAKYQGDASTDKQLLGDAIQEVQASLRSLLERSAGPEYADQVKGANAAWAQFKRMQRASTSLGAEDGVFTPEQFLNSVKALDKSKDNRSFSLGSALSQKLAEDAKRVIGSKVPDSGTPFRSLIANPLQGALAAAPTLLAAAPGIGPYSKSGQAVWQALLNSNRPEVARLTAKQIDALTPYLGLAGAGNALAYGADK